MKDYKQLEVFVKSRELVKEIYEVTSAFPKEEIYGLTNQVRRSSVSIISNISEGMGRQHKADTIQFMYISRGSLYELETQIMIASDLRYLTTIQYDQLNVQIESCRRLLNGFIKYLKDSNYGKQ